MPASIQPAPNWFDRLWEETEPRLPLWLRNEATKKLARDFVGVGLDALTKQASTPEGVRQIIAFGKIAAILKGTRGVIDAPEPTPEEVAAAVERLAQRVKP